MQSKAKIANPKASGSKQENRPKEIPDEKSCQEEDRAEEAMKSRPRLAWPTVDAFDRQESDEKN